MASSSTSYANQNYYVYDIFINHRGPDSKKPFATDLYNRLCEHGVRAFLDVEELREGDGLTSQIEGAIRTASVQIAIFSPRYAESVWCLKELVLMLKSKKPIIPVFYRVSPSELRWTQRETGLCDTLLRLLPRFLRNLCLPIVENGVYARSLRQLEEKKTIDRQSRQKKLRYDSNTIKEWRDALLNVADISGFDMEAYNGDEQQLLEKVVEAVLKRIPRKLHVSKHPIALEHKVEDFERDMCLQSQCDQTRIIGIVGHGGVGKTTLAKEIFNRQRSHFNGSCFLFDVRDKPLISLQSQLLKDLAQWNGQINSSDEGIEMLGRYLAASKALIVLDDVDHIQQMNALLSPLLSPAKNVLPSGRLILVTSRNKDVLIRWGIVESSIYDLKGLDSQQSKELFCWHAFHQSHPDVGFEKVVDLFLETCDGLPLSLMVLGAHMHGEKHLKYWEDELGKISDVLPTDIRCSLKISYDSLDQQEKNIFLDTACFFRGKDRDTAIRIWDGSDWKGELNFRTLQNRCLLEVNDKNEITMHDHLRDLGRDLAEKEPPDSWRRIWRPTDNLIYQPSPVRGVSMVPSDGPEWSPQQVKSLVELTGRLQLLAAEGDCVESILNVAQPPQLIWLRWINCPYSSLPSWISVKNLRVLQIKGKEFETIWKDESQAPMQIRELDIDAKLLNIPKSFGKLKYLEKFVLHNNEDHPVRLNTLPDEFCGLQSLNYLKLSTCSDIKSLPDSFGNLENLQTLDMNRCFKLQGLPDSFGGLASLQTLNLAHCSKLQGLPDSFGGLVSLQTLNLAHCSKLQGLPDSLGGLASLQTLNLAHCSQLQGLPDSLGGLASLQTLNLAYCSPLQGLPDSLGGLASLQTLDFESCSQLQGLPDSLGGLASLQTLNLARCSRLQGLPDSLGSLASLQTLCVTRSQLQGLPDSLGGLASLRTLNLARCSRLQGLPDSLGGLASLRTLNLDGCSRLQGLPDSLGGLAAWRASELLTWPTAPGCRGSLILLAAWRAFELFCWPAAPGCRGSLILLAAWQASKLLTWPAAPSWRASLILLAAWRASKLFAWPAGPSCRGSLILFATWRASKLLTWPAGPSWRGSLILLAAWRASKLLPWTAAPSWGGSLIFLAAWRASEFLTWTAAPGWRGSLILLAAWRASKLFTWPTAPGCRGFLILLALYLADCSRLQGLPDSLGGLASLQTLYLASCSRLEGLPDSLGGLGSLQTLSLAGCSKILPVSQCSQLEDLPVL